MPKIRFGILGTGWMAAIFAKELALSEVAELAAVASSSPGRATAFAKKHGSANAFDNYEDLLASEKIDIIYIATTTERHLDNAMACIAHAKPMLIEKPTTMRTHDTREVLAAARARGLFSMEAMWMRCFPLIRDLETVLAPIGPVERLEASFRIDIPFDAGHRMYAPSLGGGALLDIGIYPLNLLHRLWGFADAEMSCRLEQAPTGVDDEGIITFDYPDGRHARLDYSLREQAPHRAVFHGKKGTAILEDFFHPSKLVVEVKGASPEETRFDYPMMGYHHEIAHVCELLRAGRLESDLVPHRVSIELAEMMDRILSDQGCRIN